MMSTVREQFMERVIREIFLRTGSGFVLKGGAALRALYGENRLTKDIDLDFTNPKRTAESLHNTILRSIIIKLKFIKAIKTPWYWLMR